MQLDWPKLPDQRFGRQLISVRHDLHTAPMFSDEGLADLLDRYPRDRLGVYMFPDHAEGRVRAVHGHAAGIPGATLLKAVRAGQIWLNMRGADKVLPAYQEMADRLQDSIATRYAQPTLRWDIGVLISSPDIHVHYHLDASPVCLIQIRGRKRVWIYPATPPFLSPNQVEAMMMREREEDLEFRNEFDQQADILDLEPGMGVTWPQFGPHRVRNADMMNVSLSCEFQTKETVMRANAVYANANLRRTLGLNPRMPAGLGPSTLARALVSKGIKAFRPPPAKGPTPITFRIDDACNVVQL